MSESATIAICSILLFMPIAWVAAFLLTLRDRYVPRAPRPETAGPWYPPKWREEGGLRGSILPSCANISGRLGDLPDRNGPDLDPERDRRVNFSRTADQSLLNVRPLSRKSEGDCAGVTRPWTAVRKGPGGKKGVERRIPLRKNGLGRSWNDGAIESLFFSSAARRLLRMCEQLGHSHPDWRRRQWLSGTILAGVISRN